MLTVTERDVPPRQSPSKNRCRPCTRRPTSDRRGETRARRAEVQTAIAQNPRTLSRLRASLRSRCCSACRVPTRPAAGFPLPPPRRARRAVAVADLDVSGGHLEDDFCVCSSFCDARRGGKNLVRTRMLEYFEVEGAEDPRVINSASSAD